MKKLTFMTIVFVALSNCLFAQWTTSGIHIYNTNTGFVGIGTSTPSYHLNVDPQGVGGILIGNPNTSSGGFTSLSLRISAKQSGYSIIESIQGGGVAYGNLIINPNAGNVGIGNLNPLARLSVNGGISVDNYGFVSGLRGGASSYTNLFLGGAIKDNGDGSFTVMGDGGSNYFAAIRMDNNNTNTGGINFYSGPSTGGANYSINNATLASYLRMTLLNGNLGIGIASPKNKLDVNGTIHSKSVLIDLNGWSDYVFKPTYQLPPLTEIEAYISQNQHLPEIPSEQEITKSGLDVAEMNKLLMKKVEELTLYLIENDKKVQSMYERDKAKDKLLISLRHRINALEGKYGHRRN